MNKMMQPLLSLGATVFFAIFGFVYMQFVPGISNFFMQFSWLYFACLTLLNLYIRILKKRLSYPLSHAWLTLGVLTLTISSTIQGIFDIALVIHPFLIYVWMIGIIMTILSLILLLKRLFF